MERKWDWTEATIWQARLGALEQAALRGVSQWAQMAGHLYHSPAQGLKEYSLSSKVKTDPKGPKSGRPLTNHTVGSWAASPFLKGDLGRHFHVGRSSHCLGCWFRRIWRKCCSSVGLGKWRHHDCLRLQPWLLSKEERPTCQESALLK